MELLITVLAFHSQNQNMALPHILGKYQSPEAGIHFTTWKMLIEFTVYESMSDQICKY